MLVHPSQAAHTLGSRGSGRVQLLEGGLLGSRDSAGQGQALGRKSSAKAGLPSRSPRLPGKPPRKGGGKGSFPEHESRKGRGQPVHVAVPKRPPSRSLRQAGSRGPLQALLQPCPPRACRTGCCRTAHQSRGHTGLPHSWGGLAQPPGFPSGPSPRLRGARSALGALAGDTVEHKADVSALGPMKRMNRHDAREAAPA